MKTTGWVAYTLLSIVGMQLHAQSRTVELPPAAYANTRSLEISKVTLTDTATVLEMDAFYIPGYWIRVVSDSYLLSNGTKYMIREGRGIDLDSLFWMPGSGEASFTLIFDPLPQNSMTFDFIESDCEDCFKIYGIDLVNDRMDVASIPDQYTSDDFQEEDFTIEWHKGETTVSGLLWKYVPGTLHWELMYQNPFTGNNTSVPVHVAEDGTFTASITVYSPTNLFLSSAMAQIPIKVAPGKESTLFVNLPEIYRSGSRLLKDQDPYGKKLSYGGHLAWLNEDMENGKLIFSMQKDYGDSFADMDRIQFKEFMIRAYNEAKDHNEKLEISSLAKRIADGMEALNLANKMNFCDWEIINANMRKYGLSVEEAQKAYTPIGFPTDFNDFYQLIPYNDMGILLVPSISFMVRNLNYARREIGDPYSVLRHLAKHEDVTPEDQAFITDYIASQESNEVPEITKSIEATVDKYKEIMERFMESFIGEGYLATLWGTDNLLLLDLVRSQKLHMGLQDYNPLTKEQIEGLEAFPDVIKEVLLEENDVLIARIEENKSKTGYTVLETPECSNEDLFGNMLKPFEGKVVLLDIWATWCGPCRMANKAMDPLKAQLADEEDLVYVYLAGEDSPESTWKNMITDLKGSHYRVNDKQWAFLRESLNARGVPTYIIIDRDGKQVYHSTGFPGPDTMKSELMKAIKITN